MGLLKCPRSSRASKLDAHPLSSFVELSYIYSSSASVTWQSLLTHIDINWWTSPQSIGLPTWCETFSFFFLLHITPYHYSIPPIVLYPWLASCIAWKFIGLRLLKYETIAWLVIGVVHDEGILVWWKWSMTKLYDFVGMNFLWPCYFERT